MTPPQYKMKRPLLRKPSPYAQSFHSGEYHDDPMWVNKDIKNYRKSIQGLSAQLDDLIEFAYPEEVMKSVWRGLKKPSRKTLGGILRRQGEMRSIPTMVFRHEPEVIGKVRKIDPSANRLSFIERLDALIEFADPRPRNPLGEFTGQEGGPDPNAMATTYKAPQIQQQGIGIGKAAGAALAGGALGAVGSNIGKAGYESTVKMIKDLAKRRKKI